MKKRPARTAKPARQPIDHLAVGRIVRPHGVRGALVLEPYSWLIRCLEPGSAVYLGETKRKKQVAGISAHQERYLLWLDGCTDRETAEHWRGAEIFLDLRDAPELPADEYFHWQIIGLRVESDEGEVLGQVVDILETGANDVFVVRDASGAELLLPAIAPVVRRVNLEAGVIEVHLLPGLR
jgi:16S rRNA processing protein RimM